MSDYYISTDKMLLDTNKIWNLLKDCFWTRGIPIEYILRFIKYCLCFGVYTNKTNELVGFARVISDYTTFAYICDVVIDPSHRNKGLAKLLTQTIMEHADLQGLKRWQLITTEEARKIYEQRGFKNVAEPNSHMEIRDHQIFQRDDFVNPYKNTF